MKFHINTRSISSSSLLVLVALAGLHACGGSGGTAANNDPTTDTAADYAVNLIFPTPAANMTGVAGTTIRGVIKDVDSSATLADIDFVDVNGVLATLDPDIPGLWSASIPLSSGANALGINVSYADATTDVLAHTLENKLLIEWPDDVVLDSANNRLLITSAGRQSLVALDFSTNIYSIFSADPGTNNGPSHLLMDSANNRVLFFDSYIVALVAADLTTGVRTTISGDAGGANIGAGKAFSAPYIRGLALDTTTGTEGRVLISDDNADTVVAVDLATGTRSAFSNDATGAGITMPTSLGDIIVDNGNSRALVADRTGNDSLFVIDLATGERSIFSDSVTGTGPDFISIGHFTMDASNGRVLVKGRQNSVSVVMAVDLTSGNRTVISGGSTGTGTAFVGIRGLALDSSNDRVLVADRNAGSIVAVNLANGNRSTLADIRTGTGAVFSGPQGITLDSANGIALMTMNANPSANTGVVKVDLATGNRTVLSDNNPTGTSPLFGFVDGITLDSANNRVLVADDSVPAIFAVDLTTGNRTILSDDGANGSGTALAGPNDVAMDTANGRALVTDSGIDAIVAVDLTTGNRTIISDGTDAGKGPLMSPLSLVFDSANNRVLVADTYQVGVMAVDLTSGDRTVISGPDSLGGTVGTGPEFSLINESEIVFDSANNRVLVVDEDLDALLAVDLTTGDRTILSDNTTGEGFLIPDPRGIALDENGRLFVVENGDDALVVVDQVNGNRAIVSK